jgi:hypothetical protein
MPFAVGFLLFFYLDIFISLRFIAIGMMPMAYLVTAVALFVSVILFRANPAIFDRGERRLNRIWILALFFISLLQFLSNMQSDVSEILSMDGLVLTQIIDQVLFGISTLLVIVTLIERHKTTYYLWQIFSAFSCFIQALLPVTVWRLMPVKVYLFYGLIQLPMLFGFLMMIDSLLKRRFGFNVEDRPQHA